MRYSVLLAVLLCACGGGGGGAGGGSGPALQQDQAVTSSPIVFLGDSITAFWKVADCLPGALNGGIPGNTTAQMQARYPDHIAPLHASLLVILGGTNDIDQQAAPTTDSLYAIAASARNAGSKVIIGTIPPWAGSDAVTLNARVQVWNAAVKAMATTYNFPLVDYYAAMVKADGSADLSLFNADGVHPNIAGYSVMCNALLKELKSP